MSRSGCRRGELDNTLVIYVYGDADRAPFAFTGTIKKVVFDIKPHLSAADQDTLHESAHHGHVARGISA